MLCAQVDGQAHVVHAEEEAQGTRLGIDSLTCLLANEADPSRLAAMSPGKLMRFLVPEGAHVEPDQPYAEVEVSCARLQQTACKCVDCCLACWLSTSELAMIKPCSHIDQRACVLVHVV